MIGLITFLLYLLLYYTVYIADRWYYDFYWMLMYYKTKLDHELNDN